MFTLKSGICEMSSVKCQTFMLILGACFHVYAQMSLFKVENVNDFFFDINAFFDKTLWTAPFPVSFRF